MWKWEEKKDSSDVERTDLKEFGWEGLRNISRSAVFLWKSNASIFCNAEYKGQLIQITRAAGRLQRLEMSLSQKNELLLWAAFALQEHSWTNISQSHKNTCQQWNEMKSNSNTKNKFYCKWFWIILRTATWLFISKYILSLFF